jgi:enoyl-CoA hydratase/carnithine racemase
MNLVTVEWRPDTAVLVMNNPPLNLWTTQFMHELGGALEAIHMRRDQLRAVLLRSGAAQFSGGVNVGEAFAGRDESAGREIIKRLLPSIQLLEQLPLPTVAEVHGFCFAGGFELALACDLVIASDDAVLGQSEALIGTATLLNGASRLAQRIGVTRAKEAIFFAQFLPASDWARMGVINKVVPRDSLASAAQAWLAQLAQGPTKAHAVTKGMLSQFVNGGLASADAWTLIHAPALFETGDMQGGVEALVKHGGKHIRAKGEFHNR